MIFPFEVVERIDPKYIGVPNINFTLIDEADDREEKYKAQRIERGFDNSELWSLDYTIARFIHPRLVEFKKDLHGWPGGLESFEVWTEILDKMILAFSYLADDEEHFISMEHENMKNDKIDEGLKLFAEYYRGLWD